MSLVPPWIHQWPVLSGNKSKSKHIIIKIFIYSAFYAIKGYNLMRSIPYIKKLISEYVLINISPFI